MSHASEDLDALFESIAADCVAAATPSARNTGPAAVDHEASSGIEITQSEPLEKGAIYDRLGGIVRQFHDSLRELGYDKSLSDSAESINNAQDRLAYIAELTENAANTVLNAIDISMPLQRTLSESGKQMEARWSKMLAGELSIDDFKALAHDSLAFSARVSQESEDESKRLLEIMMAQDFQDITGQIIKKVIVVTKGVEKQLAQLLIDAAPEEGKQKVSQKLAEEKTDKPIDLMAGPNVPTIALAQNDVDDLLEGLGF